MVQQVHLQDRLLRAHGLHREVLGADDGELLLLRHLKIVRRGGRGETLAPQALGQAGLVLQDLPLDISHSGVDGAAHVPVRSLRLRPQQRGAAADSDLHRAQVVLLHREGDKRGGILVPEVALQLGDLLLGVFLDGIIQRDFLAGKGIFHRDRSFRMGEAGDLSPFYQYSTNLCA